MAIRVGTGKNAITLTGLDAADIEAEARKLIGPVIDVLEQKAEQIIDDAQKTWPVKTGKSRDGFYKIMTIDGFRFEVSILNKQEYVGFIKSSKEGKEENATRWRSPLQTEIRGPVKDAKKELSISLKETISNIIKEE